MHMVGILLDAHGWHIDRGIWLIHYMDDIFFHMVDVHRCCALWANCGT
jgi:hypothetical protein